MRDTSVVDLAPVAQNMDGGNEIWIEALPARIFHTPQYGPVEVTPQKLQSMVANFNKRVRGQDIATDFDHGNDRSKGNQASGWFKEFAVKPSSDDPTQASLYARIDLTDDAKNEIKDKKWRYFSLEWDDAWMDNEGQVHSDVIMGGAFTNRPIAKRTMPINFSEEMWNSLDYETKKEFSVWSTAFVNNLPDSSFLFIQSGGKKDSEGKTTPRSLRHFPFKGPDGKIDLPHLRNAIARIPQAGSWLSDGAKTSLQARARKMLGSISKAMAEGNTAVLEAYELLTNEGFDITPVIPDITNINYLYSQGLITAEQHETIVGELGPEVIIPITPSTEVIASTPVSDSNVTTGSNSTTNGSVVIDPIVTTTGSDTTVEVTVTPINPEGESKELEHSEPGTGSPPAPRTDGDGSTEPDRTDGWRVETPPDQTQEQGTSSEGADITVNVQTTVDRQAIAEAVGRSNTFSEKNTKGGNTRMPLTPEEEFNLRTIVNAGADGDVVESARIMLGELQDLRQRSDAYSQERKFADEYPAFWAEHNKLMTRDRDNSAKLFSESVSRVRRAEGFGLKETAKGLSTMSLTKIHDLHMAFAEGKATQEAFEDCIRTIVNGGIVEFGEVGTATSDGSVPLIDTTTATGIAGARKLFGELVATHQKANPDVDYRACVEEVGRKHPDLYDAYTTAMPA